MLFCSVLFHDDAPDGRAIGALNDAYGATVYQSDPKPLTYTS